MGYKFLIFLLSQSVISQDLTFEDQGVQEGDVGTRFFNVNLGDFDLGGVGESVVGTVIGNAASGFLNDCFGKRKRSIIMDRIVKKRSAQEVSNGQVSGDDVNNRLFCLNNNNNNNRPNCLLCSCNRDYNCRNYCNKCSNYGTNNNFGFSGSSGSSSYGSVNCNTCSCNSDTRCYDTCDKCYSSSNNNNYGSVNCNTCSCRSNSCFNTCRKCVNTNSFSSSSNSVNCNTCSCSYDTNCRNRCNCYSYEKTTGGMECEPEMKVDKKGLLSLNKDHHQHLLTMLEIKDFPVPLIKDQVLLMLLFLLETQEINEYKKMSN